MAQKLNPWAQYQNQWNVKCDEVRYIFSIQSPNMMVFRKSSKEVACSSSSLT